MEKIRKIKHIIFTCNNDIELIESILILGPTGAGKSRLAKIITAHRCWVAFQKSRQLKGEHIKEEEADIYRKKWLEFGFERILKDFGDPWDSLSISNIEGTFFESELFGYEKGAFTDAKQQKNGRLEKKFLFDFLIDEIGNARISTQQKLLEVLQEKTFTRMSGREKICCSARLVFATNRRIERMVLDGSLQIDFFYRLLNGGIIELLPLRERIEELEDILKSVLTGLQNKLPHLDPRKSLTVTAEDLAFAKIHRWPGNIRELEAALRNWLASQRWDPSVTLEETVFRSSILYEEVEGVEEKDPLVSGLHAHFNNRIAKAEEGDKITSLSAEVKKLTHAAQRQLAELLISLGYTKSIETLGRVMENPSEQELKSTREWVSKRKRTGVAISGNEIA